MGSGPHASSKASIGFALATAAIVVSIDSINSSLCAMALFVGLALLSNFCLGFALGTLFLTSLWTLQLLLWM